MEKFIPKKKMSKKAQKLLAAQSRKTWLLSPVTRKVDSRKIYNRKKISRALKNEDGE